MKARIILAIIIMGFSGIIAQVLLLRELLITFHGNELSIGIILSNWLILEAIGVFFLARIIERQNFKIVLFVIVQLLFSLSFPVAIYFSRTIKLFMGISVGEALGISQIFFSSFLILSFTSLMHGTLFTLGCSIYNSVIKNSQSAISVGMVYVYETIGTLIGGTFFIYFIVLHFHSMQIALGTAILNFIMCLIILGVFWRNTQTLPRTVGSMSVGLLLLFSLVLFTDGADVIQKNSITKQWQGEHVLHYQNSIYGNIVVTKREEQYTFFSNGIPIITTPMPNITFIEEFVHLPMLYHPRPEEILIISGGVGGVINEVLKHPVKKIDYVELDPLILELVNKFPTFLTNVELTSSQVKINYVDGRYFIRNTFNNYDLVLIGLSNPRDLQINRFFTKEFFLLVKNRLKQGGLLVINLPGSITYFTEELLNLNRCILNTLKDVFTNVKIIPGDETNLYLISQSEGILLINHKELNQRLYTRKLKVSLLTSNYIEYKLHPRWIGWFSRMLEGGTNRINKDFHPLGVFYSITYWNERFSPYLQKLFKLFERINLQIFLIFLIVFVVLLIALQLKFKGLSKMSIPICIATTGFAGMLFQLAIVFAFQTLYGYLFYWIGVIVTAFMAGVAMGGKIATHLLVRIEKIYLLFLWIEISIIVFSVILSSIFLMVDFISNIPFIFLILSFFSGLLMGLEFPLANSIYLSSQKKSNLSCAAGLLYGSDLFGGWLGGILGGVVLLPIIGLSGTGVVVFMFKMSSFIIFIRSLGVLHKVMELRRI